LTLAQRRHINEAMFNRLAQHRESAHTPALPSACTWFRDPGMAVRGLYAVRSCSVSCTHIKEPSP
jgi:hypothetical protein